MNLSFDPHRVTPSTHCPRGCQICLNRLASLFRPLPTGTVQRSQRHLAIPRNSTTLSEVSEIEFDRNIGLIFNAECFEGAKVDNCKSRWKNRDKNRRGDRHLDTAQ